MYLGMLLVSATEEEKDPPTHTRARSCPGRSSNVDVLTLDLKLQVTEVKLEIECGPSGRFGVATVSGLG